MIEIYVQNPCQIPSCVNHKFRNMACIAVSERLFDKINYGTDMNSVLIEPRLFVLGATSMAFVNSIWVPPKYRQFAPTLSTISIELLNRSPYLKFSQGVKLWTDRASSGSVSGSGKVIQCKSMVTLGNGSGTHFQASQCISMDLAAAAAAVAAADARSVHTLKVSGLLAVKYFHSFRLRVLRWSNFY